VHTREEMIMKLIKILAAVLTLAVAGTTFGASADAAMMMHKKKHHMMMHKKHHMMMHKKKHHMMMKKY